MNSAFYQNSNLPEISVRTFIESNILNFYDEIQHLLKTTKRKFTEYHLTEYGKLTLLNLFINGIIRNDIHNFYNVLCEFGIDKIENDKYGRADLIVEDTIADEVFYIELKINSSKENAPATLKWKDINLIKEVYMNILSPATNYLKTDYTNYLHPELEKYGGYDVTTLYSVALVFDVVKFVNKDKIPGWYYEPLLQNEFYAFKTFPHGESIYGLACYGLVEKQNFSTK